MVDRDENKDFLKFVRRVLPKLEVFASALAAFIGVFVVAAMLPGLYFFGDKTKNLLRDDRLVVAVRALEVEAAKSKEDYSNLRTVIDQALDLTEDTKVSLQIGELEIRVSDIDTRISKLESAILHDPAKALEIPLLRKDLENIKNDQIESTNSIRQSVDRIYDLTKWLLGALAVSIASLAIANLFKQYEGTKQE